jgi:hypothetical protein
MLTKPDLSWLIRGEDKFGSGAWGARRIHKGKEDIHKGVDLLYAPGKVLYAWEEMNAVRYAVPYTDGIDADILLGILLRRPDTTDGVVEFKLLYVDPLPGVIPSHLPEGTAFGRVQDLTRRYPGISNHVHLEMWQHGTRVDPTAFVRDFSEKPPEQRVEIA